MPYPGTVVKAFKDFEKKTIDAWDIDEDDCFNYRLNNSNEPFPISIADSEEVAKKVIKDHKENQEKLVTSPGPKVDTRQGVSTNVRPLSNGPGKALRQENAQGNMQDTFSQTSSVTTASMSPNVKSSTNTDTGSYTSFSKSSTNVNSLTNTSSQTSFNSDNNVQTSNFKYSPYLSNRDIEEDSSRCEKFRQILNKNPINLQELEKISWRGIPKLYRPTCWKLLSVKI